MKKNNFIFIIIIVLVSILLWVKISNNFSKNTISNLEESIINISEKSKNSVVSIVEKKDLVIFESDPWGFFRTPIWSIEQEVWGWSWFFITNNWIIITNKHVVSHKNSKYVVFTNSMRKFEAEIIYIDKKEDIALLKINYENENKLNIINNQKKVKVWSFTIAIWNAFNKFENSVSFWIISWKNRKLSEMWLENMLQTDASINPWNSGWPLINLKWEVIWINTAIINNTEKIWFAIPINQEKINTILKQY